MLKLESAKEAVVLANTPAYLFEKLRNDPEVEAIGRKPLSAIVERLKLLFLSFQTSKSLDTLAEIYVFLVALSFKPEREAQAVLEGFNLKPLSWGQEIKQMILQVVAPEPETVLQAPEPPLMQNQVSFPEASTDKSETFQAPSSPVFVCSK